MDDEIKGVIKLALSGVIIIASGIGGCMYGMPKYNVYEQALHGEAELAKANYSKQVAVQEAHAKMESAKLLADAEVIRAEGVAKANKIIGDSLNNNEAYLRYLYINNLEHTQNQIIYVPTEANLPILERRK
jgi:regulator of protease activity HflC (stomatin/prohibitin superfamily)